MQWSSRCFEENNVAVKGRGHSPGLNGPVYEGNCLCHEERKNLLAASVSPGALLRFVSATYNTTISLNGADPDGQTN